MSRPLRMGVFLVGAVGLAVAMAWAGNGLPPVGHYRGPYGDVINRLVVPQLHTPQAVTAVVFDFRGFDTLGEEFILFASAVGVALLLRVGREEVEEEPSARVEARLLPSPPDAVGLFGLAAVGITVVVGLSMVAHGHLTPGGGFQGGVVLASAALIVFVAGRYLAFHRLNPVPLIDAVEGTAIGGFPAVGFIGLVAAGSFLTNVLPLGRTGELLSGGSLPVLNATVGVAVAAAFVLILSEFLEQTLAIHRRR
jgi:multicomponent Na+:H+ antiporter subunit B